MKNNVVFDFEVKKIALTIFFISFGSVFVALISQHFFDMQPCAWCILQRMMFTIIGLISLFVYLYDGNKKINACLWGIMNIIASFGPGVALYQLIVASKSFDCQLSIAEKIIAFTKLNEIAPFLFGIFALCGESNPTIFGISYVIYSLCLFMILSIISLVGFLKFKKIMSQ